MRILHIIGSLDPEAGGPSRSVRVLLSYAALGYIGEVVSFDDPSSSFLSDLQVPVHAMGRTANRYGFNPKLIPWLKENHSRFDGIVINGLWQFGGYAAQRVLRRKTPYVVFTHGMLDPYFRRAYPSKHFKKWLYWAPIEYRVLRDAWRVLFTSESERQLAEQTFWLRRWNPRVIPYGTDGASGDPCVQKQAFFEQCPQVKEKRFLLFLSRIHRKKGCDMLIEAFGKTAALDPELELVMAGPDPQRWCPELQQAAERAGIAHRVHWPGMIAGDAKWGAFYAAEAFILPSHQENFGIAVAEAMSCGAPVLLADKVNIAEDIAREQAGLMEPDTLEGTCRLLERWIALPPAEKKAMGVRAKESFHRNYDMQETAKAIIRIFEEAKNSPARAK